jgi:hypothetical protein
MPRLPQRATAAILGTILAVGIPTGFALAANENARHGVEVSAVARTNVAGTAGHGAAVSLVAKTRPAPAEAPAAAPAAHPANHGADVSAVAKDHTLVGGAHNNHGGAVSAVAHKH